MLADLINATFEFGGAIAAWLNFRKVAADRNPILGQWLSFFAGLFLVAGNIAWVVYAVRYRKK